MNEKERTKGKDGHDEIKKEINKKKCILFYAGQLSGKKKPTMNGQYL